ncbi:bifunctional (p)ppGpp synthetase/guanosine-3',5'-bis(diphosphate) 3'-pyrophosphohydrolase [Thiomicrorhabdus sp. 6S2-11]|uniref:GTP pyrophosphokinase n=1 Tax=Thiomicrorhabdus marina TaxID=2818442 RepID=A0ABS3Q808_9GAMM|nr:bifunctional (p)ppGpp synthetase/guanosine-3',5'-bis(diphosphate) 3'-pyrophosphohydrolase [Thiomicrorhabdus marina]MBO1928485.1 bifunctional (p)ppGpp synthetase/guanosine-3',5'-bis(diphosphate) 3'-pyrophosphohydrolase [Thiomicrorhabdus marina]
MKILEETIQAIFPDFDSNPDYQAVDREQITQACELALKANTLPEKTIVRSLDVAQILADLKTDKDTLIATLISDGNLADLYSLDAYKDIFGENISKLVEGIRQLNKFQEFQVERSSDEVQNERLRQMLLAMTVDVRIMIVKLAYRVARLRHLKYEDEAVRRQVALETEFIFSPLANRLGIAQLKWELEDLSFRFTHPEEYKKIAQGLKTKRIAREDYIKRVIDILQSLMHKHNIDAKITGRPKHIFSIWKKMKRKNIPIEELYDLRAVRIYVDSIQTCYEALGLIHSHWNYVQQEFDDYIATPKENGYQSIHTVVIGPENNTVEIQIRTHDMHHHAEFGVAAHWLYKEGGKSFDHNLERSIANVRQMLETSDDPDIFKEISTELQSQHIYVMTPNNEIITLVQGATPLDFAYHIHTELGHRCRGAKINGRIQPLSYTLRTGDKVEVLTIKNGQPSRNWLNPNLGYLTSTSARHKVKSWFNKQNRAENIKSGEALFHREVRRLHAEAVSIKALIERFHAETEEAFFEDLGKGRINERQLTSALQALNKPVSIPRRTPQIPVEQHDDEQAFVIGATNLKTYIAPCCHPHQKDDIIGFVTRGRGVTIHKRDCANILHLSHEEQRRLIEVTWDKTIAENPSYTAELNILAFDRRGLLRDIMSLLTMMDINLVASNTLTDKDDRTVNMKLTLELNATMALGDLLDKIEMIQNVESASIRAI